MIDIVSQIEPTQTALKRRRGQLVARYFRWAVALSLIAFVLVAPSQAIFDMYVAFIPIQLTLTETSTSWIVRGLSTFLGYLALSYIGIVLLSSRKRSVLYLRHFDMPAESHRISKSIEGGIGRHYRLVTLDDSRFSPIEVPRLERVLSRAGIPIAALILTMTIAFLVGFDVAGHYGTFVATIFYAVSPGIEGFLLLPLLPMFAIVVAGVLAFRWYMRRGFRFDIKSNDDIAGCSRRVARLGGWLSRPSIAAPQAMVVKVTDDLWRETVVELVRRTSVTVFDVSEPTENLVWEFERVFAEEGARCVLVGNGPLLRAWINDAVERNTESARSRMVSLLQSRTILAYDPQQRSAQRTYARNLRLALDNVAVTMRVAPMQTIDRVGVYVLIACTIGLIWNLRFLWWPW